MAEVRIFNPDGSEAELSGNGVRQAVMYLRRSGWTDEDTFTVRTAAGDVRPRIEGELCTMDIGRARLRAESDYPAGADDGRGTLTSDGREFEFQFVQVGNPQVSIEAGDELEELDLAALRARHRAQRAVPEPHERVVLAPRPATPRSGRASSSAAWGRRWRPAPAPRAPPWRPRCAASTSPVTVVLDGGELVIDVAERPPDRDDRLGAARVRRNAERGIPEGAECDRVADWTDCPRTCSPSWSGRSGRRRPPEWT